MYVIRPVREGDLQGLFDLASKSKGGLTTLPPNKEVLAAKIAKSEACFGPNCTDIEPFYLMVLADNDSGKIVGSTAIFGRVGLKQPFYNYKLLKITQTSQEPAKRVETELLTMANDYTGATELGTLYLDPVMRGTGPWGRFLSKVRFLLIAEKPDVFADTIIAELRGYVRDDGTSPFWDAVGRHFFDMEFLEADLVNGLGNNQFIGDLMPKHPIYTNLISDEARQNIGRPHNNSAAAMRLLMSEGFRFRGAVDIFDSGPLIEANKDDIYCVRTTKRYRLAGELMRRAQDDETLKMIANSRFEKFTAVLSHFDTVQDEIFLPQSAIDALGLEVGDEVLVAGMEGKGKKTS